MSAFLTGALGADELLRSVSDRLAAAARPIDTAGVAALSRKHFPEACDAVIALAEDALCGRHILPGTGGRAFPTGNPPKWRENPVGDDEYVWSLNRMAHWNTLLRAHALTGKAAYMDRVLLEMDDWLNTCPRPPVGGEREAVMASFNGVTPWRTLEAGIRMYSSWPWAIATIVRAGRMPAELLYRAARSLFEHGEVLAGVCPMLWPDADHNHYFMENLGLFALSCAMPELAKADAWRARAMTELQRCAAKQFTPEGGQIEGCPLYHHHCVRFLRIALTIADTHALSFPDSFRELARGALDHAVHVCRPTGDTVPFGDSDADRLTAQAAVDGYLALGERRWLDAALTLCGADAVRSAVADCLWDVPRADKMLDERFLIPARPALPLVNHQRALEQVMMRTDWTGIAHSVFFACKMPGINGHAHIDAMSFDYTALGRALLVDPGRFCYREDADRRDFKSAEMHNALTLNGRGPYEYASTWRFGPQGEGGLTFVQEDPALYAAEAAHTCFAPVTHRRLVAIVDGRFLLVADRMEGAREDDAVCIYFHMDTTDAAAVRMAYSDGLNAEFFPGRISDFMDQSRPSTRLKLSGACGASGLFAAVCVPGECGVASVTARPRGDAVELECAVAGKTRLVRWRPGVSAAMD